LTRGACPVILFLHVYTYILIDKRNENGSFPDVMNKKTNLGVNGIIGKAGARK
jgi:hypothetical protein